MTDSHWDFRDELQCTIRGRYLRMASATACFERSIRARSEETQEVSLSVPVGRGTSWHGCVAQRPQVIKDSRSTSPMFLALTCTYGRTQEGVLHGDDARACRAAVQEVRPIHSYTYIYMSVRNSLDTLHNHMNFLVWISKPTRQSCP